MSQKILDVLDVVERHGRAMLTEIRQVIGDTEATNGAAADVTRSVGDGEWTEVVRLSNQGYDWPPNNGGHEDYDPFAVYDSNGTTLALAQNVVPTWVKERKRKQIWVFRVDPDGTHKRPITPFVATDDHDQTGDMIAIIRGNGSKGRGMYSPDEQLPPAYAGLRVEILGDRIAGHYNKLAVVAHEDDAQSMLRHGHAQVLMRGW